MQTLWLDIGTGRHHFFHMNALDAVSVGRLSDVAAVAAGHPLRGAVDDLPNGDVAVIQMRNVDPDAGVDWPALRLVQLPPTRKTEFLKPGDVIFSTRGTRNYAVALDSVPHAAVCSPHFFVLRVRSKAIHPRFLAWQINQGPSQEYLQREATGSHILNIRREVVERLEIVVPPMERQAAIVAFAEAAAREKRLLSALIENRQQQINALAVGLRASDED